MDYRVFDHMTLFFEQASKPKRQRSDEDSFDMPDYYSLEELVNQFAEALVRILMADKLQVSWEDEYGEIKSQCKGLTSEKIGKNEELILDSSLREPPGIHKPIIIQLYSVTNGGPEGVTISLGEDYDHERKLTIVIFFEKWSSSPHVIDWKKFKQNVPILKFIFLGLNSLILAKEKEVFETKSHVLRYFNNSDSEIDFLINDAKVLLIRINKAGNQTITNYAVLVVLWLVHRIFGTGWTERLFDLPQVKNFPLAEAEAKTVIECTLVSNSSNSEIGKRKQQYRIYLLQIINIIEEMILKLDQKPSDIGNLESSILSYLNFTLSSLPFNLHPLCELFKTGYQHSINLIEDHNHIVFIRLFTMWTLIHEQIRNNLDFQRKPTLPLGKGSVKDWDSFWELATKETVSALGKYLQSFAFELDKDPNRPSTLLKNWLHLWFFYRLLQDQKEIRKDVQVFRVELAYALRESLRYNLSQTKELHTRTCPIHESTYAASLRTLVEYHAHDIIGLPIELDLRRYLDEIGEVKQLSKIQSPTDYLQHVLDVYLTGHCLLEAEFLPDTDGKEDTSSKPRTVVARMVSSTGFEPQQKAIDDFKYAFSLAALFHDISHLVFPFEEGAGRQVSNDGRWSNTGFEDVETAIHNLGMDVTKRCIADLAAGNYFDLKEEKALGEWLENQQSRSGEPDHGLLSAWYLHHICSRPKTRHANVLRMAVRAILLHNAVTVPIDATRDPVPAFLTLCNEFYDWESSRGNAFSKNALRQKLILGSTGGSTRKPRFKWVKIKDLTFHLEKNDTSKEYELKGRFPSTSNESWPTIQVWLQDPESLDIPTFTLCLMKAQRLARIMPSDINGWSPTMEIAGALPPPRLRDSENFVSFLEKLIYRSRLPIRPALLYWLNNGNPFEHDQGETGPDQREHGRQNPDQTKPEPRIYLRAVKERIFQQDIRPWLPSLEREAIELLNNALP